jgi:hypothetical protein
MAEKEDTSWRDILPEPNRAKPVAKQDETGEWVPEPNRVKPMVGESRLEDGCLTLIGLNLWWVRVDWRMGA